MASGVLCTAWGRYGINSAAFKENVELWPWNFNKHTNVEVEVEYVNLSLESRLTLFLLVDGKGVTIVGTSPSLDYTPQSLLPQQCWDGRYALHTCLCVAFTCLFCNIEDGTKGTGNARQIPYQWASMHLGWDMFMFLWHIPRIDFRGLHHIEPWDKSLTGGHIWDTVLCQWGA